MISSEDNNSQPLSSFEIQEQLAYHYKSIISLLGEDTDREGLVKTPERVAKAMQFLTQGYAQSPEEIISSAMFREDYRQICYLFTGRPM